MDRIVCPTRRAPFRNQRADAHRSPGSTTGAQALQDGDGVLVVFFLRDLQRSFSFAVCFFQLGSVLVQGFDHLVAVVAGGQVNGGVRFGWLEHK